MQWKRNARKVPDSVYKAAHDKLVREHGKAMPRPRMETYYGKPRVVIDHVRDACVDGEIVASQTFKAGQVIVPAAYVHKGRRLYGETKDVKVDHHGEWWIYLDSCLRSEDGEIVLDLEGYEIDLSGWFRESDLSPVEEMGSIPIKPGAYDPDKGWTVDPHVGEDGATRFPGDGSATGRGNIRDAFGLRNNALAADEPWRNG